MRRHAPEPAHTARQMIDRHGLRASAVASHYASEAQICGDSARLHHWREVQAAIGELRRTTRERAEQLRLSL